MNNNRLERSAASRRSAGRWSRRAVGYLASTTLAVVVFFVPLHGASARGISLAAERTSTRGFATTPAPPTAAVAAGSTVGPLFGSGLSSDHSCTASVVDTPTGNVIVTAAHCVTGTGIGTVFAPGYDAGATPYGSWIVTGTYVATGWLANQDPQDDYAFLTVAPSTTNVATAPVQSVVGGVALGLAPVSGATVTITGYATGSDDAPILCTTQVTFTDGYPSFTCGSYPGGTSGGPWMETTAAGSVQLVGVIGGLNQGGCTNETSYSALFTPTIKALLQRAISGLAADDLPAPGSDSC